MPVLEVPVSCPDRQSSAPLWSMEEAAKLRAQLAEGGPKGGLDLLGGSMAERIGRVAEAVRSGLLAPVEIVAVAV